MQEKIIAMLEASMSENRGVTLFINGQTLGLLVTGIIRKEAVTGRNREYRDILVRLDAIDGCAM
ncbi:MAG: hypothetical protein WAU86_01985 [Oricola sp.]